MFATPLIKRSYIMTASLRPVSRMAAPLMSRSQRWNTTGTKSEAAAPDSAASSKPDASTTTEENNKSLLEEKDKQIVLLQDSYRRALADAENVRQRSKKELEAAHQFAITKFSKDLLDSADILQLALKSVPETERTGSSPNKHLKDLYTGVDMTFSELMKTLKRHGVEPFDPTGEKFDHNMHQALFQSPVPEKEPGTVFQTTKIGYTLNGRVLRPAQVGVVSSKE